MLYICANFIQILYCFLLQQVYMQPKSDGPVCCDWSTLLWLVRWPRPGVPNPAPGDRLSCTVHLKP